MYKYIFYVYICGLKLNWKAIFSNRDKTLLVKISINGIYSQWLPWQPSKHLNIFVVIHLTILCRSLQGGCKVFDGEKIGGSLVAMVLDQDKVHCRAEWRPSYGGVASKQCDYRRNITSSVFS